ncbi:GntR family transcriptional regulator [Arthrobacter sp. RHLT1-20]
MRPESRAGVPALRVLGNRDSLRERAIESLRDALIAGDLVPGEVYSAPALAEMLGVSATPVREAMIDLAREGLVDVLRNKGYRAVGFSDRDLDELTELRALIEVPTMGKVAELADPADVEALRPLADELNATAAAGEIREFVRIDMEFHLRLLAMAGNRHLVEEVHRLRTRSRLRGLAELAASGQLVTTANEHAQLLDLLIARDKTGVEQLMARHIGHIRGIWAGQSTP